MKMPTDDELAAWYEGYFGATVYDGQACDDMRAAIEAATDDAAAKVLVEREWGTSPFASVPAGVTQTLPVARALRSRFQQPIDDAFLRAEGFDENGKQTIGPAYLWACQVNESGWYRIWVDVPEDDVSDVPFLCRTPDRLHEVVECLKGLYGPGEDH